MRRTSGQNGLDDDPSAGAPDDAEPESTALCRQPNHLHLNPIAW